MMFYPSIALYKANKNRGSNGLLKVTSYSAVEDLSADRQAYDSGVGFVIAREERPKQSLFKIN